MARPWPQDQERKAVGWLGRGVVELGLFRRPQHGLLFSASLARQRILRCLGWTTARVEATSPTAAWRQASTRGQCTRPCTAVERNRVSNKRQVRRRRIRCFLHSPSDANCIFGRPWRADWPDWATAVCLAFSARVPDCRFASNRTVAVRLRGESQQCVLSPLVCRQHGKQNLFFNQRRQIKRSR